MSIALGVKDIPRKVCTLFLLCTMACCAPLMAQGLSEFHRGDLATKLRVLKSSSQRGDATVAFAALDFSAAAAVTLKGDEQFLELTETAIKALTAGNCRGREKEAGDKLCRVFTLFSERSIKAAVIDGFSVFFSTESLRLVNDFFYSRMQNPGEMDEALLKATLFLGNYGNSASFNMLFIADILGVWPSYGSILADAYGNLAEGSEREILQLLATVPVSKKIRILKRLDENPKIPKKICGEAAENALSQAIYTSGGKDLTSDQLELALLALKLVSQTSWTRASAPVGSCFSVLKAQYEAGRLSDDDFSEAIREIASISSPETAKELSSYLDQLNKQTEKSGVASEAVVLSVIDSLGGLGDKTAFDSLLYTTYLDYPEEVLSAARSALANLKW